MLKEILSSKSCAECQLCCVFDREDIWELPVISGSTAMQAEKLAAGSVTDKDGKLSFNTSFDDSGLARCPMLGKHGCLLEDKYKPFDCKIWPFRAMRHGDKVYLTLAPICEAVNAIPEDKIFAFVNSGLRNSISEYIKEFPTAVKPYAEGYRLITEL